MKEEVLDPIEKTISLIKEKMKKIQNENDESIRKIILLQAEYIKNIQSIKNFEKFIQNENNNVLETNEYSFFSDFMKNNIIVPEKQVQLTFEGEDPLRNLIYTTNVTIFNP